MFRGIINKIIPFSSVDGPGNRTAIFLQGCNFNCLYCHNPETINPCSHCQSCVGKCPVNALSIENNRVKWNPVACVDCDNCIGVCDRNSTPKTREMTADDVISELLNYLPFISGITISGGECTMQPEFIEELFSRTHKLGLTNYLDSNGYVSLKDLGLYKYMDKAMIDLKAFDNEEHIKLTGRPNDNVIGNIKDLAKDNKLYEVRTVIVPDVLDNEYTVKNTSMLIGSIDPYIRYKLIKYRPYGVRQELLNSNTPDNEYMDKLVKLAESMGCKNIVIPGE